MDNIRKEDIGNIISTDINWTAFKNRTVLVTGANGMLPSYMVEVLLELNRLYSYNVKILALVRNLEKARACFADYSEKEGLFFIVQDVSDPITIEGDIHYIIHAASQASPLYYGIDPVGTLKANVLGTYHLLELALKKDVVSFLFFSTGAIYGDFSNASFTVSENMYGSLDSLNVRNCYSESKKMGENMCACYFYQYGVKAKIARIFHTLGPNINLNDGRTFSDFCKSIIQNKNIVLHSDGMAKRSFCYVSDAVVAYFKILLYGNNGKAYNVGGDESQEITMKELAESLVALYPQKQLKVIFDIDVNDVTYSKMRSPVKRILPDLSEVKKLGWIQKVNILDAFKRTIDSHLPQSGNN